MNPMINLIGEGTVETGGYTYEHYTDQINMCRVLTLTHGEVRSQMTISSRDMMNASWGVNSIMQKVWSDLHEAVAEKENIQPKKEESCARKNAWTYV